MKQIIDYTISEADIVNMADMDLADMLLYTDRDRCELEVAVKIYWWCIKEINRRLDSADTTRYLN